MQESSSLAKARYIFDTGRMIHDHVYKLQIEHVSGLKSSESMCDLSLAQLRVLMLIRTKGQVTIRELSEQLGVSPPSASAMVDRLVEKGLLSREPSQEDRRKVVVSISPQALNDIQRLEEEILCSFVNLVDKIGQDTANKWCEVLGKVKSVLEAERV
jgi:DNA-binding MarR family transcriptional regulator